MSKSSEIFNKMLDLLVNELVDYPLIHTGIYGIQRMSTCLIKWG